MQLSVQEIIKIMPWRPMNCSFIYMESYKSMVIKKEKREQNF